MALTSLIDPRIIPAGTFGPSAPRTIASSPNPRTLTIYFTSTDWDTGEAGLAIDYELDVSTDGGANWQLGDAATVQGGARNARNGQMPSSSIPLPVNTAVQIRGRVTLNQRANSLGLSYDLS